MTETTGAAPALEATNAPELPEAIEPLTEKERQNLRDRIVRTVGRSHLMEHAARFARASILVLDFCDRTDNLALSPYEFCKARGLNLNTVGDAIDIVSTGPGDTFTAALFGAWLAAHYPAIPITPTKP